MLEGREKRKEERVGEETGEEKDDGSFVHGGGRAALLRQQKVRQGDGLGLPLHRPRPRPPIRPRHLAQQGLPFALFLVPLPVLLTSLL